MRRFRSIKDSLGSIDVEATARLITAAADIALVLDRHGVIQDLAFDSQALDLEGAEKWIGKPWIDTVTVESRQKVEELLKNASGSSAPAWRQVNHPTGETLDIPMLYAAAEAGDDGKLIVIGRDLRAVAELQQRLVDAQQSMERDYSRLRHAETRYRLLFQTATDAVMIVDMNDRRIQEVNPAGARLMGENAERLAGRSFADCFVEQDRDAALALLVSAEVGGRGEERKATLAGHIGDVSLSASLFRQNGGALILVRLVPASKAAAARTLPLAKHKLLNLVESAPDGLIVSDSSGRIIATNAAFLDLAELIHEDQALGQSLDRWLGRPGVDLRVITSNLKDHGSVRLFATTLRGEHGASTDVELSAVTLTNGDRTCFGFSIRNVDARLSAASGGQKSLPRSVDQMTDLVGRVPLKELVRDATDVIEKLCIEAALELTGDNRASAAEMLGLSRQSLYVKLRRYGMAT
ncbi:MAG: transcriptional regulator PpsR [Pseudomonadota bacterium]